MLSDLTVAELDLMKSFVTGLSFRAALFYFHFDFFKHREQFTVGASSHQFAMYWLCLVSLITAAAAEEV